MEMYEIIESDFFIRLFELLKWTVIREAMPWREFRASAGGPTQCQFGVPEFGTEFEKP